MEVEVTKVGRVGLIKGENFGQCLVYIHFIYKMYEYNNQTMYKLHISVSLFFFHCYTCTSLSLRASTLSLRASALSLRASALSLRASALLLTHLYAFANGPIRTPYVLLYIHK